MVTSAELKKILLSAGVGGMFGRGIRLFDTAFMTLSYKAMDGFVQAAVGALAKDGLTVSENYRENIADCDNWALWIWAEVTKQWAIYQRIYEDTAALTFGVAVTPNHALNIAVCAEGVKVWNYGVPQDINLKTIKEVEFR